MFQWKPSTAHDGIFPINLSGTVLGLEIASSGTVPLRHANHSPGCIVGKHFCWFSRTSKLTHVSGKVDQHVLGIEILTTVFITVLQWWVKCLNGEPWINMTDFLAQQRSYFWLQGNRLTTLLASAVQQRESAVSIHIPLPFWASLPPPSTRLGHHGAPSWAPRLYRGLPLDACFTHGGVYMSGLLSQFIPPSPSPLRAHVHSLHLCDPFFSVNSLICTIFLRFHIYALIYNICSSLSDILHSV